MFPHGHHTTEMKTYTSNDEEYSQANEPSAVYCHDINTLRSRGVEMLMRIDDAPTLKLAVQDIEGLLNEYSTRRVFHSLLEKWEYETGVLSNPKAITTNGSFQEIVKMGEKVVPFILEEIRHRPSLLYRALELIYDEQITKVEIENKTARINIKDCCRAWIEKLK